MIKGLYAAASSMLANLYRQQSLAHNVANLDTPGFKRVITPLNTFIEHTVIHPLGGITNALFYHRLGKLGLGVENTQDYTDFTNGALKYTGQTLDVAIEGAGFFVVKIADGEGYTRDGRFTRDAENHLVTIDGYQVLDDGGQPIELPEGLISIQEDGTILADGEEVAKLGLVSFENPQEELIRALPNIFIANQEPTGKEEVRVAQGFLEMSNINPADLMAQMVSVTRAYEAAQKMVQNQDELLGQTINTLGRL